MDKYAKAIKVSLFWFLVWFSGILWIPGSTFDTSQGYRVFAELMSENSWAGVLSSVGLVSACLMSTRSRWPEVLGFTLLSIAHSVIAAMFFVANPIGAASGIFAGIAGLGYFAAWSKASEH